MRRIAIAVLSVAVVLLSGTFSSCSSKEPQGVTLEETPVISGGLGWGVVSLSYVRLMVEPSYGAPDSGTARRGEKGRIVARSRSYESRDEGVWYRLELGSNAGWLHESALSVYRTEAEARNRAESGS